MKVFNINRLIISAFIATAVLSPTCYAEDEAKSDKTGTNPINFSNDASLYYEFSWLNTEGDGTQNFTTGEVRTSLVF